MKVALKLFKFICLLLVFLALLLSIVDHLTFHKAMLYGSLCHELFLIFILLAFLLFKYLLKTLFDVLEHFFCCFFHTCIKLYQILTLIQMSLDAQFSLNLHLWNLYLLHFISFYLLLDGSTHLNQLLTRFNFVLIFLPIVQEVHYGFDSTSVAKFAPVILIGFLIFLCQNSFLNQWFLFFLLNEWVHVSHLSAPLFVESIPLIHKMLHQLLSRFVLSVLIHLLHKHVSNLIFLNF